jgi:hypothetical protein
LEGNTYSSCYTVILAWCFSWMKYCDYCNAPLDGNACLYCYNNKEALQEFDNEDD